LIQQPVLTGLERLAWGFNPRCGDVAVLECGIDARCLLTREFGMTIATETNSSHIESYPYEAPKLKVENSIMKYAGMFKDDPQFEEVLVEIEAYRRELDLEREELIESSSQ
jgi:hypothetical protein